LSINHCILDGKTICSLDDFYDQLSIGLGMPHHFGRNLDALWDVLSADVRGPIEILWKKTDLSRNQMGRDFDQVVSLMRDLEKVRSDFILMLEN
jgi:ribonuclease inhibitor